jgi:Peptidase family M28/Fibronectin type III domain/WD40-like Beta Propeller Repeat
MKRPLPIVAALVAAVWIPLWGDSDTTLETAALAWDRGDYTTALKLYLEILDSPNAAAALETIALQTGELYTTTELTRDGEAPVFSPDSRRVAFETGSGLARRIRIIPVGTAARVEAPIELPGVGAAFSVDGTKVAYIRFPNGQNATAAQTALDAAPQADRPQRLSALNQIIASESRVVVRELATGRETAIDTGSLRVTSITCGADSLVVAGYSPEGGPAQIYDVDEGRAPIVRTTGDGDKVIQARNSTGTALVFTTRPPGGAGRGGRAGGVGAASSFGVLSLPEGRTTMVNGSAPSFSRDGASLAFVAREGTELRLMRAPTSDPSHATIVRKGAERIDAPALSPDGSRLAFQMMPKDDWEIYVINTDGSGEARVTREIQHDLLPMFLTPDRILAVMGEPRHRRSYLYDLPSMKRTRLFHNNTVRTIAPEYSWTAAPDGTRIVISAERDGDTLSPERGIYVTDLSRQVTAQELRERVKTNLDAEQALVANGKRLFAPIAAEVKTIVAGVSVARIYGYEKALFDFDSKYVTQPGNKLAATFLFDRYKSFGYEPEYQPFEYRVRNGPTGPTANVIATLKGAVNPELVYVVSSHYDSVAGGPGADDDSSGTAALLETARILAGHPQPATIIFASFTGEEAGLLGSREFVRRAVDNKLQVVGALNNDMIGWSNDYRLDNTIRYSNAGIRDVQHAAAMQFSNLITYDALYYKNTDAAAYYEAYGDIVGGIGSYPVLGNPHYHQPHDLLESINHQLIAEVAKTTVATVMLLASSPSRLKDLHVDGYPGSSASLSWTPSPEKGVTGYIVSYGPAAKPEAQQVRVVKPSVTLSGISPGTSVAVKAVNAKGLEGWDWARVVVR